MAYFIDSRCTRCGDCIPVCPTHAIHQGETAAHIQRFLCVECLGYSDAPSCTQVCSEGAILPDEGPWFADTLRASPPPAPPRRTTA
jgi:ferredoxin